jgi:putative oxidoreductase
VGHGPEGLGVVVYVRVHGSVIFHTNLAKQQQLLHFLKNVAIVGGLLLVTATGRGALGAGDDERTRQPASAA